MPRLTEYTKYDDAQKYFSKEALWQLFDGNKNELISVTNALIVILELIRPSGFVMKKIQTVLFPLAN